MRRGPEAVDADTLPVAGNPQRTPAYQAGAEQRRERDRIRIVVKVEGERGVRDRMRGETSVARVSGEDRRVAE